MSRTTTVILFLALTAAATVTGQPLVVGVAGQHGVNAFDGDSGSVAAARFDFPIDVALDQQGRILVCDQNNHRIRRIDPVAGSVVTVAGSGPAGTGQGAFSGDGGAATQARLNGPRSIAVDASGNLYVCDSGNHRVRRVDALSGVITSVAGSGPTTVGSFSGDGGPATQARLNTPQGLAFDTAGNLYLGDRSNHRVRRIDAVTGFIRTVAGNGLTGGGELGQLVSRGDYGGDGGPATEAGLDAPVTLAFNRRGNLCIGDHRNDRVRLVDSATGLIRTVAGSSLRVLPGDGMVATQRGFGSPAGLAFDARGDLFIGPFSTRIYRVALASGLIYAAAGAADTWDRTPGSGDGGPALEAMISGARGLAFDPQGNLVFADTTGHRIRKLRFDTPEVLSIQPASVANGAGQELTLRGTRLDRVTGLRLTDAASTALTGLTTLSAEELRAQLPAGVAPGVYGLTVQSAAGAGRTGRTAQVVVQATGSLHSPPVAVIRTPSFRAIGEPVLLDGSASFDPDAGDTLSYQWSVVTTVVGAPALTSTSPVVTYDLSKAGEYRFTLRVTDSSEANQTTSESIMVLLPSEPFPIADRTNQTFILPDTRGLVPASLTTTSIFLDGRLSVSLDGNPITYEWALESKPADSNATTASVFSAAAGAVTRFQLTADTLPGGKLRDAGQYVVALRVRGSATPPFSSNFVERIYVNALAAADVAPTADPGLDRNLEIRITGTNPLTLAAEIPDPTLPPASRSPFVRLDGRASVDPNVPPLQLTYDWTLLDKPAGSAVSGLTEAATATPRFVPDRAGLYRAQLVVRNALFSSAPATVRILVKVAGEAPPPAAQAIARNTTGTVRSSVTTPAPTFAAGQETVVLDGTQSLGGGVTPAYRWEQLLGAPVALTPSSRAAVASFVPPAPGRYRFALDLSAAGENRGLPAEVELVALEPGQVPFQLRMVSSSNTGPATGAELPQGVEEGPSRSLRVTRPAVVTLTARAADPSVGTPPLNRQMAFFWRQLAGPMVVLTAGDSKPTTSTSSVARFAPTTGRVHLFECRAVQLDSRGLPTGVDAIGEVRIVVDQPDDGVPTAVASAAAGKAEVQAGTVLALDGHNSTDTGPNPSVSLAFRWTQVAGPPVVLSNPYSSVATFVVPDFQDGLTRTYGFQLYVEDGRGRSEPAEVLVQAGPASPLAPPPGSLLLANGLTLVGLPASPTVTGRPFDASDLARLTQAGFVARTVTGPDNRGRFVVYVPRSPVQPFPVEGNRGYLVARPAAAATTAVTGAPWPVNHQVTLLPPGLSLVAYPRGVPGGETSRSLADRTGSSFVVKTVRRTDGRGAFHVYLQGLSTEFDLADGAGYLVSVPGTAPRTVVLPSLVPAPVPPSTVTKHRASAGVVNCLSCHVDDSAPRHGNLGVSCESCHQRP